MSLFKSLRGKRENLPEVKTDGYAYFCVDDGTFFIDYTDEYGVLQRKQLNAKDAETLMGASLSRVLDSNDMQIPTSKTVVDALNLKSDKAYIDKILDNNIITKASFDSGILSFKNNLDEEKFSVQIPIYNGEVS